MFSVKVDVVHGILELHLGGTLSDHQLGDFAQELKSVLSSMPEPPQGVLFERKKARPTNHQVAQLLGKLCELIQNSGTRRLADVGSTDVVTFTYDDKIRRFDSEEEARRWLLQFSTPPAKPDE